MDVKRNTKQLMAFILDMYYKHFWATELRQGFYSMANKDVINQTVTGLLMCSGNLQGKIIKLKLGFLTILIFKK